MNYFTLNDCVKLLGKGHDSIAHFEHDNQFLGVVCDGVSSSFEPEIGSQVVSRIIIQNIKQSVADSCPIPYHEVYLGAVNSLQEQSAAVVASENNSQSCHATTVITALVQPGIAEFSYVGNGAIFEIRPEWFNLPTQIPTPWGITNYLNPHSRFIDGENRLTKTIQARSSSSSWIPDVVRIQRSSRELSYYMICTDGLYSSDEVATAWGDSKDYYIIESRRLLIFLEHLRKYHWSNWQDREQFSIELTDRLRAEQLITDDLSYILFVPEP